MLTPRNLERSSVTSQVGGTMMPDRRGMPTQRARIHGPCSKWGDREGLPECSSAREFDSEHTRAHTHNEVATHGLATRSVSDGGLIQGIARDQASADDLKKLREVVRQHRKVFAMSSSELGRTSVMEHKIDTGECSPDFPASPAVGLVCPCYCS